MIQISKGELIAEPVAFVFELILKLTMKTFGNVLFKNPNQQWGVAHWLLASTIVVLICMVLWIVFRKKRAKNA
jgi:membrane protein DedA with SNARE-associated domain